MSTKTTFKRIALVAVAALGLGVLSSVAPANAVAASMTLDKSSITVVSDTASDSPAAVFAITVTNTDTATGLSAGESITASITGGPALEIDGSSFTLAEMRSYLKFTEVKQSATNSVAPLWGGLTTDGAAATDGVIVGGVNTAHYAMSGPSTATTAAVTAATTTGKTRTYYISVGVDTTTAATRGKVLDAGVFNLQFDLQNTAGATIQRATAKVDFVSAASSSGAVLTAAAAGQWFVGDTPSIANQSTDKYITATLTNRDGGAVRTSNGGAPVLSAQVADASTVINYQTLSIADTAAESITAGSTNNGVYGVYSSSAFTGAKGPLTLTVRYGLASATASIALAAAATAATTGTGSVAATGAIIGSGTATLPLTTKSVTFSYKVTTGSGATLAGQTGYAAYYTLTNGASCSAGDMSVADTTAPVKVLTDANGVATLTVANTYPLTGCTVSVTWIGAAANVTASQVVTWAKPVADLAISNPGGNIQALLKSTNKTTWTIVDQFGTPMVGATVTFGHTGSNAPTVAPAAAVTDANGQVSYSVTDALAVAAGTDVVSVATVNAAAPVTSAGSVTITYKSALDVVASLYSTYTLTGGTATLVPTTVIAGAAGTGIVTSALDQIDWSKAQTTATVSALTGVVALNFTAKTAADVAVTGIPTTVTATGGYILGADGKLGTSRTIYANETIYVVGAKTGVVSVTATNGTLTSKASVLFVNAASDARVLSVTESAGTITAKTVDFQGNPVAGVTVTVALSAGAGRLGNGSTSSTFVTAADGTVSIDVNGAATATVSIAETKAFIAAGYGDLYKTVVTPAAPAGVSKVTVATNGNTVIADSAQAAVDAAAEATDAANAATDAANAAAEAADAATAAAQDAADAVAALSTQVSEMVSALKKQITALTNLVIKIQKKVKA